LFIGDYQGEIRSPDGKQTIHVVKIGKDSSVMLADVQLVKASTGQRVIVGGALWGLIGDNPEQKIPVLRCGFVVPD
jgi:hypothetical protein